MPTEINKQIKLEIAHVLFIDIVGYSKLSINQQRAVIDELTEVVRSSGQYRKAEAADRLIKIPTGDGMALVFYTSPEAPAQCAIEINGARKEHPRLQLRMGVHSGPVSGVIDVNGHANLAGAGLNMAQRVMDCGDAGHILVSKRVADDLGEYEHWRPLLHDLGDCEVKHGMRVSIVNLHADEVGNPQLPKKFQALKKHRARMRWAATTAALLALAVALVVVSKKSARSTSTILEKSIAVLPFENLSEDKANAYFADGIQDEILTKLASIADLKVISRTSTAKYKSRPEDLKTVSQQLGVATVVEGTVQRAADKVRVNVQLIDARADSHLWAKTYDREIKDVFAVESEVSQEIADALQAKLSDAEATTLATAPTKDPVAYDLFFKGEFEEREAESSLKSEAFDQAVVWYRQAIDRDPKFALAMARLVESRMFRRWFLNSLTEAELPEVKSMAEQALALAPDLAEAHIALGEFYYYGHRQYDEALSEFQRAAQLQPNNVRALEYSAFIHRRQGQLDLALSELQRCAQQNPRDDTLAAQIGGTYSGLRMWSEATQSLERSLALNPHSVIGMRLLIFNCLNATGDIKEARRILASFPPDPPLTGNFTSGSVSNVIGARAYLSVVERDFSAAMKVWEKEITDPAGNRERLCARVAIHVLAGDAAGAQTEAEKARVLVEARLRERPEDTSPLTQLSWIYLALKRNADALKVARQAVSLFPPEKDATQGAAYATGLAEIEARTGETDEAVKSLRWLLSGHIGGFVSIKLLKIDPVWDPIRKDPGFQQLLAGKEQIGPNN
jgi:TolB-like protein/class 3 adenylate cyclase/cytochrome c-type biogenesis protein CcmH/NrfG